MKVPFNRALCLVWLLSFSAAGCTQSARALPDERVMAEAAVRADSEKWWAAAKERDAEKFISYYAMEAQLLPPNARIVRGRDDIRSAILTMMATPQFHLDGQAARIEAARSGDIAWETGTFTIQMQDAKGEVVAWPGKYVAIWKKRAGGDWRIISNIFNSDLQGAELTSTLN